MVISFRNQSLMVFYIQVFLKEKYPEALVYDENTQESITVNDKKLRVTGIYDYTTYQVLSCYMQSYFPNERFPKEIVWDESKGTKKFKSIQDFTVPEGVSATEHLIDVITENIEYCKSGNPDILNIPERVQSYFLNEVVTPYSPQDEVFRIQKMLYNPNKMPDIISGEYYGVFEETIRKIQQTYIDKNSYIYEEDDKIVLKYPERYKDFKVTGYCDPWTEVLIENGNK